MRLTHEKRPTPLKSTHIIGLTITSGFAFLLAGAAVPAHATVVKNSFLKTTRTIRTTNSKKQVKLTIPKNTVVQAAGVKWSGHHKYVYINADQLSYHLRKPLLSTKSTSNFSRWLRVSHTNFQQIKKPVYLSYYNTNVHNPLTKGTTYHTKADLWKGHALPVDYQSQSGIRLRVTTDGYLEYFASSPYVYETSAKPSDTAKVIGATYLDGLNQDIMTFNSSFSALPFKKSGNQYTLTISEQGQWSTTATPNEDNLKSLNLQKISKVEDQEWYWRYQTINY
ncbi:hypothetical protein FD17_GL000547 [Lentilactobacillus sunkii DSM 19904]|uniref:Uncharacterized protein n=1 Tax=Lentilactobacillus sunkii DSM 19904 TaxID=1423808 RepID=A0A0R1L9E2_9LACO|nr:hypothetical protein FD17_GL000547 [Lentilactobacillus sunkii DSM 19904]